MMGQTTIGILFGVQEPEGVELYSDDGESGLLERWQAENIAAIIARRRWIDEQCRARPGTMPYEFESGEARIVPDLETETGTPMLGFWVAAGASGKDGLPILDEWKSPGYTPVEMTRAGVRSAFPKAYRNAVARWARFRRWCDAHRDLAGAERLAQTAPSLWLVPTEVA